MAVKSIFAKFVTNLSFLFSRRISRRISHRNS